MIRLDRTNYFIVDIFEKEIMELGDRVDLNYTRFNRFEVVHGDAPRDHHFYNNRCCYSSCCCIRASETVEKEWRVLERELASREKQGVSFFARSYKERKELMRVVATVTKGDRISHSLFFFDVKFSTEYPYRAPSFFYHPYGLPLSPETAKPVREKFCYNILDVFRHIQELVLMNTNKSSHQMLDMLERPLMGFEDFVTGHFRKKGALILQNMMDEMDIMGKERDRNMFWKMYIAFEDNKSYCEHLLNSDLKEELKRFKKKEYSLSDYYSSSSSTYFPAVISRFDDVQKISKSQNLWNKLPFLF